MHAYAFAIDIVPLVLQDFYFCGTYTWIQWNYSRNAPCIKKEEELIINKKPMIVMFTIQCLHLRWMNLVYLSMLPFIYASMFWFGGWSYIF